MAARLARNGAAGFFAFALLTQAGALAAATDTLVLKTETGEHRFAIEVARTRGVERAPVTKPRVASGPLSSDQLRMLMSGSLKLL